jgi:oxygen-independent coproporphyrinogen III oxidase
MAGIYIHIPFCRQKCFYCDFYKSIKINLTGAFINALKKEIMLRRNYLGNEVIKTVYLGGGTPSVLNIEQIITIIAFINKNFIVSENAEITLEANPDDLDINYLNDLRNAGVNRLSIGVQSLHDSHLKQMNRRHNVKQAVDSVINAGAAGFTNISVDLIYGFPGLTRQQWKSNLNQVFLLPVVHLSAYHITYHKGTVFYDWLKNDKIRELSEEESFNQFEILMEETGKAGFEHYEISNFAKNSMYSVHNTSYWTGKEYLGLGASAHSYNGKSRRWNISNLERYIKAVENNKPFSISEHLGLNDKYNEYILTNLRTKWGVSAFIIEKEYGKNNLKYFMGAAEKFISLKKMERLNNIYLLSRQGLFTSDDIIAGLMII